MTKEAKTKAATVTLEGDTERNFNIIEAHITESMPGIKVDRASVLRHALHMAAQAVHMAAQEVPTGVSLSIEDMSGD